MSQPKKLFYSYSHKDDKFREKLVTHLAALRRDGMIDEWHDRDLAPGSEWKGQIDKYLNFADIILLLVSADFMASDYCYDVEMTRALERHEAGEAVVIPVILKPTDWHAAPFGKLQALPKDGKPVSKWGSREEAFLDVANGIRRTIKRLSLSPGASKQPD